MKYVPLTCSIFAILFLAYSAAAAPPPLIGDARKQPRIARGLDLPTGAASDDGSEFLHGKIGIVIILPESTGETDANTYTWTQSMRNNVISEIQNGMNWWKTMAGDTGMIDFRYFIYDSGVNIGYEMINRDMGNENGDQAFVLKAILDTFGHSSLPTPFEAMKAFNHTFRAANPDLDWVTTILVAHDGENTSNKFPTSGLFAFAYLGGPFMVMTYTNAGWGIANMDLVSAHEMGHIFYALDEYAGAGMTASETSGYIPTRNENTLAGGGTYNEGTCIMRSDGASIDGLTACIYSRCQMGLRDSDADFIPDILDYIPLLTLTTTPPASTSSESFQIGGFCFAESHPNLNAYGNRNNITINQIDTVQYRLNGGSWSSVTPQNAFDTTKEFFSQYIAGYSTGTSTIDVRGAARVGHDSTRIQYSSISSYTFFSSYSAETSIEPFFPAFQTCTNLSTPTFKWKKWTRPAFKHYRLDFSDSSSFASVSYSCTTSYSESSAAYALPMGLYYWRVVGVDTSGISETSNYSRIWIDTSPPVKPTITLPRPDSFYVKFQPRCSVGNIADTGCGVAGFVISYSSSPGFAVDTIITSADSSLLVALPDSGRYYLRFAVDDSATNRSAWSDSVTILLGLRGDINNDAVFNAEDLFLFGVKFGSAASAIPAADLDENGTIDLGDVRVLKEDRRITN